MAQKLASWLQARQPAEMGLEMDGARDEPSGSFHEA